MQVALVGGQAVTFDLARLSVVGVVPWLHLSEEMHHLGVAAVPANGAAHYGRKAGKSGSATESLRRLKSTLGKKMEWSSAG